MIDDYVIQAKIVLMSERQLLYIGTLSYLETSSLWRKKDQQTHTQHYTPGL